MDFFEKEGTCSLTDLFHSRHVDPIPTQTEKKKSNKKNVITITITNNNSHNFFVGANNKESSVPKDQIDPTLKR
jgi:hypothetical protein